MPLKAFGHPGIPLHRASNGESLCQTCVYDADDTCNFPQRPHAKECTLYQNLETADLQVAQTPEATRRSYMAQFVWQRNWFWIGLAVLLGISFLIALQS